MAVVRIETCRHEASYGSDLIWVVAFLVLHDWWLMCEERPANIRHLMGLCHSKGSDLNWVVALSVLMSGAINQLIKRRSDGLPAHRPRASSFN